MKILPGLFIILGLAPTAQAADVEAGRTKVATVCAACHKPLDNTSYTFTLKQITEAR